jgi:hypothetical protein
MKKFLISACILFSIVIATSGQVVSQTGSTLQDFNGKPIPKLEASETTGSFFTDEEYQRAIMVMANGKQIPDMKVKLNLKTNKVYYIDETGAEMEAVSKVKRIVFTDKGIVYENGFPAINKQDQQTYYQVVISGKASLLLLHTFVEIEYKEFNSATATKKIDKVTEVFGASPNAITKLSKEDDVMALLADKKKDVYSYITSNNLKCKKRTDYENVIKYYNSLGN